MRERSDLWVGVLHNPQCFEVGTIKKKNQEDLFLRLSEESQVFLNSARLRQRAHPRADGGRGVGAFIFDKVHLQVSHRDAFSCTHPASAGARSEEPIDAANARNC